MKRYRRHPSVVATELSGEVVALHLDTKRYYTLNPTASRVWLALEESADETALVAALTSSFDVPEDEASENVATLLGELLQMNLIEPCDS